MAIKLKKEVINISDELNRELETLGFNITFGEEEIKPEEKKEDKKTTEKK